MAVVPSIVLLRAEGLDTPAIQRLYEECPQLLTTSHAVFSSALAALRQLAELLREPDKEFEDWLSFHSWGVTRLGAALSQFHTTAAHYLICSGLASLLDSNLRLRRLLGIRDSEAALALFENQAAMFSDAQHAEGVANHLLGLHFRGKLSMEEVRDLANKTAVLQMTPAEFDQRWRECGGTTVQFNMKETAAEALGELLQAAAAQPSWPLQAQYLQQGAALVEANPPLAAAGLHSLKASWASLRRIGLTDSQIVAAAVHTSPGLLTYDWAGDATQRLAAWLQEELGIELAQIITMKPRYTLAGVARMAMRAAFLRAHRPGVWDKYSARGTSPLLSLLSSSPLRFYVRASCTEEEVDVFNRAWLRTPAGRRYGSKPKQQRGGHASP